MRVCMGGILVSGCYEHCGQVSLTLEGAARARDALLKGQSPACFACPHSLPAQTRPSSHHGCFSLP
jgi:hypothetical protein